MHTSALTLPANAPRCQIAGRVLPPVEVRLSQDGGHVLCITLHASQHTGEVKAQVPIAPGEQALKEAHALAKRVNAAAKQGRSQLTLSSPLILTSLHLPLASIEAHEEPDAELPTSFKSLAAGEARQAEPALF